MNDICFVFVSMNDSWRAVVFLSRGKYAAEGCVDPSLHHAGLSVPGRIPCVIQRRPSPSIMGL